MKNYLLAIICFLLASYAVQGQSPAPTPTPDNDDIVKISTNLIQIDVSVKDEKGNVVTDLKPGEIEIYENGEKQEITNFSFISNVKTESEQLVIGKDRKTTVLPPTTIRPNQVRRTVALVVDDLTLSITSINFVKQALKKFVDTEMREGDLVAIIRTGAGMGALQQFTNDKRQLYAAIEKIRWNPAGNGKVGAFAPIAPRMASQPSRRDSTELEDNTGRRNPDDVDRELNDFKESLFAAGTLGAINYIVRGMQELPGRKSIMLLSDGFSLITVDANGFQTPSIRVMDRLKQLIDMANRASVVINTMDARGLAYIGLTSADTVDGRSPAELETELDGRRNRLLDTQDALRYLAKQTGGSSVMNNNDLVGGIRRILDDQSYYLVGYIPDEKMFDPKTRKFNDLVVKVTRPGLRVNYRSGFFSVSDEKIQKTETTREQRLVNALTSPFGVNDIALTLNALFNSSAEGVYIRSLLHVRAQDLTFTDGPDGMKTAIFDLLAVGYGDNGSAVDSVNKSYTMSLNKTQYDEVIKSGFIYNFVFPVKKPGAYQLRISLADHGSSRVGSANQFVDVPDIKKDRLAVSGVAMDNISVDTWNKRQADIEGKVSNGDGNPLGTTTLRQFLRGTVLNYSFTIYNPKRDASGNADIAMQATIYRDGKLYFEGKLQAVPKEWQQADPQSIKVGNSLNLGSGMLPGDYILQLTITDNLAKEKQNTVSQFVPFEIID